MTSLSRLEAQGIPVSDLGDGPVETKAVVYNAGQLRSLLDLGLDAEGRQAHYDALFGGVQAAPAQPGDGADIAGRLAAHVIGNGELSAQDQAAVAPAFPLTLHATVAPGPLTVSSPFDLSTLDGSPRVVVFTDVTLEQGGYFVCWSTPLSFTCDTLTRNGDSGSGMADFNILGRPGVTPPTPPTPGSAGQAASGGPGECSSAGIAGPGGGNGGNGNPGTPGTDGTHGVPGTPSMQATITITRTLTASQLSVYSKSGPGGQGGNGGQGGAGQQGGNGGDGVTCGCTGNAGGPGGNGGAGGPGGRAGDGGNGIDAAGNVVLRVPRQEDVGKVHQRTEHAPPGGPGQPGPGGPGGAGGGGSSGGKNNGGGSGGGAGNPGATGGQGVAGTVSGRAAQITVMPG